MKTKPDFKSLQTTNVEGYEASSIQADLRRDLHLYVEHIRHRTIKRSVRENKIPKADAKRIARLLGTPHAVEEIDETGESAWVNVVDDTAFALGFTSYDKEGEYQGYSSASPSFSDNYIEFKEEVYQKFLDLSLQKQEQGLFSALVGKCAPNHNEFFIPSLFGRLDTFSGRGYLTGVLSGVKFDKVRNFLFQCLKSCMPGNWYETASFIQYLKKAHPFFLIPEKPAYRHKWEREMGRYHNFTEYDSASNKYMKISDKDPDSFERVEGRFVERFLEHIPLMLGYVDLLYDTDQKGPIGPSFGVQKAFKIHERFLRFMSGQVREPSVMVHPNHEIHIESDFYPVSLLKRLSPFSDLITSDRISILKLNRMKAVNYMAEPGSLDVKELLRGLATSPLPLNIVAELDEWSGHSETFILYQDCGLLEGRDFPSFVKDFELESLSANLHLVRSPDALFTRLEKAEQVPLLVRHAPHAFVAPPEGAISLFTRKAVTAKTTKVKESMTITQKVYITLFFETEAFLNAFEKALILEKCIAEVDRTRKSITYAAEQKEQMEAVLARLKKDYRLNMVREKP